MLGKALRNVADWLILAALAVSFVWSHEDKLVGDGGLWLQLGLATAAVAHLSYAHLQEAWSRGQVGQRDALAVLATLTFSVVGLGIALFLSTDERTWTSSEGILNKTRTYTNLFPLLLLSLVAVGGDAVGAMKRYHDAKTPELLLPEDDPELSD